MIEDDIFATPGELVVANHPVGVRLAYNIDAIYQSNRFTGDLRAIEFGMIGIVIARLEPKRSPVYIVFPSAVGWQWSSSVYEVSK